MGNKARNSPYKLTSNRARRVLLSGRVFCVNDPVPILITNVFIPDGLGDLCIAIGYFIKRIINAIKY